MRTKTYLIGCLWTILVWGLVIFMLSAPPEDFPYCTTYEQC
jgi:hypothetical protein